MKTARLENSIQPKTTREEEEMKILKSLDTNVSKAIFHLIEELFEKGINKDEDLDLFKQELLRMVVMYLPYKKKLDDTYGNKETDIFIPEIKSIFEEKINKIFKNSVGTKTDSERKQIGEVYNKLTSYISELKVEKIK